MIRRSGQTSISDILDDHIRQRFGVDSYERIDGGLPTTKKLVALQKFNMTGTQSVTYKPYRRYILIT